MHEVSASIFATSLIKKSYLDKNLKKTICDLFFLLLVVFWCLFPFLCHFAQCWTLLELAQIRSYKCIKTSFHVTFFHVKNASFLKNSCLKWCLDHKYIQELQPKKLTAVMWEASRSWICCHETDTSDKFIGRRYQSVSGVICSCQQSGCQPILMFSRLGCVSAIITLQHLIKWLSARYLNLLLTTE